MAQGQTNYKGTLKAVIPQNRYFWRGDLPRKFLTNHGKPLLACAKTGQISEKTCIAIAGLIEERKIRVYGDRDGLKTATLNTVKDAIIEARKWATANQASLAAIPGHFDLGALLSANNMFETLETDSRRPANYANKMKIWDDKVIENGLSVGWREYWKVWDCNAVAPDQAAVFDAAKVRCDNAQILAEENERALGDVSDKSSSDSDDDSDLGVPDDAYSIVRNKKRTRGAAFKDSADMTDGQIKAYLAKMEVFVETDIAKDPNLPATHRDHSKSAKLLRKYEREYYRYFLSFMEARKDLLQAITDELGVESLAYEDCPQKFHIVDHYSAAKLIEMRVWKGMRIDPLKFKVFFKVGETALRRLVFKMAIESHKAQVKKKYIKDGARLKPYASLRGKPLKSFKLVGGAVRRVAAVSGAEFAEGRFDDFDVCLATLPKSRPKKRRRIAPADGDSSDSDHGKHKSADVPKPSAAMIGLTNTVNLILGRMNSKEQDQPANNVYATQSKKAVKEMRESEKRGARHFSNEFVVAKELKAFRVIRATIAEIKHSSAEIELYTNIMSNDLKSKAKVGAMQGLWGDLLQSIYFK